MKYLGQDSLSPDQDLNLGPPKYEARVLTTRQQCSVLFYHNKKSSDWFLNSNPVFSLIKLKKKFNSVAS
jgi:hypothetical protein